jgi:hypothetical protein
MSKVFSYATIIWLIGVILSVILMAIAVSVGYRLHAVVLPLLVIIMALNGGLLIISAKT